MRNTGHLALALLALSTGCVAPAPSVPEPRVAARIGEYTSAWGPVRLGDDVDGRVVGTYGTGILSCRRVGRRLDCTWLEASGGGRASFEPDERGGLRGTWGLGRSASDGGAWDLTPLAGGGVSGVWESNWGLTSFVERGDDVDVQYRQGEMSCRAEQRQGAAAGGRRAGDAPSARSLQCLWTQGASSGRAALVIESSRLIRGTWGNGRSADDGGEWVFVRR